jgi:glycogen synthase
MRALILTNEYPPHVYGGAGVHVAELTRALRARIEVEVRSFGADGQPGVRAFPPAHDLADTDPRLRGALAALSRDVGMAAAPVEADVVHAHTWYAHLAGVLVKLAYGVPLAVTVHSLEPLRPWKREQLGGGYEISTWVEKTALEMADAVVAVSRETRDDVLRLFEVAPERVHVIHNGIDADFYHPDPRSDALARYGIGDSQPYLLFVGRITRQKGIVHLVRAIRHLDPRIGVVLCAGQPDTPEIGREMEEAVAEARRHRPNVVWIPEMVPREELRQLYSHAALFVCPSVYEPFGLINLEAMACATPVVASAVGGIPEVVVDGETGVLVPLELARPMEPADPDRFEHDLADAVNRLMAEPGLRDRMGEAGRQRAIADFSWEAIAERTVELYGSLR